MVTNTPLIPLFRRQRQMDLYEFQASWSYTEKPYLRVWGALLAAPYH